MHAAWDAGKLDILRYYRAELIMQVSTCSMYVIGVYYGNKS